MIMTKGRTDGRKRENENERILNNLNTISIIWKAFRYHNELSYACILIEKFQFFLSKIGIHYLQYVFDL